MAPDDLPSGSRSHQSHRCSPSCLQCTSTRARHEQEQERLHPKTKNTWHCVLSLVLRTNSAPDLSVDLLSQNKSCCYSSAGSRHDRPSVTCEGADGPTTERITPGCESGDNQNQRDLLQPCSFSGLNELNRGSTSFSG